MCYIEMHRGPAAYVLGPPSSRSRDLELEGGVIACHVDYVHEPQDSHVRVVSSCNRTSITSLCNYGYVLVIPRAAPSFESV